MTQVLSVFPSVSHVIASAQTLTAAEQGEAKHIVKEVDRFYRTYPRGNSDKNRLVGAYLERAFRKEPQQVRDAVVVKLSAKFDWAALSHDMKDQNILRTLLDEAWPKMTANQRTDVITQMANDGRVDFLVRVTEMSGFEPCDRVHAARRLIDLGFTSAVRATGRDAYVTALAEQSPAVATLFASYDKAGSQLRRYCEKYKISRDDLAQAMMGVAPASVKRFYVSEGNTKRGMPAAVGLMILQAQAGAARVFANAAADRVAACEAAGDTGNLDMVRAQAAAYAHTANRDDSFLDGFKRRAGSAHAG